MIDLITTVAKNPHQIVISAVVGRNLQNCHIWTPPCLQAGFLADERRVCGHISGFVMEPCSFRALMVVARQLLGILTAC
jgi:hypothetical protein